MAKRVGTQPGATIVYWGSRGGVAKREWLREERLREEGLRKFRVPVTGVCVAKGSAVRCGLQQGVSRAHVPEAKSLPLWLAPTGSANCPGRNVGCTSVGRQSPRDALHLVLMGRGS